MGKGPSRLENTGRKLLVVRGVGEELGLQAEAPAIAIGCAAFSCGTAIQMVSGVELDARECGENLHGNAGSGGYGAGDGAEDTGLAVYHPVMVIAPGLDKLGKVLVDMSADGRGNTEVHRGTLHRGDLSCRDGQGVCGGIAVRQKLDCLVQHRAAVVAGQIEIGVAGQAADSILVTFGLVADGQSLRRQGIGDVGGEVSGVALLTVGAEQGEGQAVLRGGIHGPDPLVIAQGPAVEVVDPVFVGGQGAGLAVQGEFRPANAVGEAAYQSPQKLVLSPICLQAVKTQEHIHGSALPVRNLKELERTAEGDDAAAEVSGAQGIELYHFSVRHDAEGNGRRHRNSLFLR